VVEQLAEDYPDHFAPVTMHVNGDGYETSWGQSRLDTFYGLAGLVPTFMVDAKWQCEPSDYRYYVEQQLAQPADVTLELTGEPAGGSAWDVNARVCSEGGGDRAMRIFIAPTLDAHPELPEYTTNALMQNPSETDISLSGGECTDVSTRITLDATSVANSSNIVIVAWAQKPSATGPSTMYQAGLMRWPFPAGSRLTTITVEPSDVTIAVGEAVALNATGFDQHGAAMPLDDLVWSLGVGDGTGGLDPTTGPSTTFTASAPGTRQIICTQDGVTSGAVVTIREASRLAAIEVDPASTTVAVGSEIAFDATGRDQYGDEFGLAAPSWTVVGSGDGVFDPVTGISTTFTGSYPGSATVTCTEGDVSGTAAVEITGDEPRLDAITVAPATASMRVGNELALTAVGSDQYGRSFTLVDPTWSVTGPGDGVFDPMVGAATSFTATGAGSVELVCSADGVEGSASVAIAAAGLPAPRKAGRRVMP